MSAVSTVKPHDDVENVRLSEATCMAMQVRRECDLMTGHMMRRFPIVVSLFCLAAAAFAEQPVTRLYTIEDGLARNWVLRIRRDTRGRLWFCTVEGLSVFDGERFSTYTTADGLPHRVVEDILDAGGGVYWIATASGLF